MTQFTSCSLNFLRCDPHLKESGHLFSISWKCFLSCSQLLFLWHKASFVVKLKMFSSWLGICLSDKLLYYHFFSSYFKLPLWKSHIHDGSSCSVSLKTYMVTYLFLLLLLLEVVLRILYEIWLFPFLNKIQTLREFTFPFWKANTTWLAVLND